MLIIMFYYKSINYLGGRWSGSFWECVKLSCQKKEKLQQRFFGVLTSKPPATRVIKCNADILHKKCLK